MGEIADLNLVIMQLCILVHSQADLRTIHLGSNLLGLPFLFQKFHPHFHLKLKQEGYTFSLTGKIADLNSVIILYWFIHLMICVQCISGVIYWWGLFFL